MQERVWNPKRIPSAILGDVSALVVGFGLPTCGNAPLTISAPRPSLLRAYPLAKVCLKSQAPPVRYPGGCKHSRCRFGLLAVESDLRTSTRFDLRQTCQCSPSPGAHKAEVPYTTSPNRFRAGEPVGGLRNIRLFPSLFVAITCQKPFAKGIAPSGISLTAAANVRVHTLYEG